MFNKNKLIEKVQNVILELNGKQIEREEAIAMLILAFFAKKNLLFIGEPGTSKTGLISIFSRILKDGKVFEVTIKDDTKYEELFGDRYYTDNGKMAYDTSNSMIDSNIASLDEIWKGNSKILNSLLSALSDYREVEIRGQGKYKIPNISTFAASNELPLDRSLDALDDRFIIRMFIEPIQDNKNWIKFIAGDYDKTEEINNTFSINEVEYIHRLSKDIVVPDDLYELLLKIKNHIKSINIKCSDRRFGGSISILKVSALLNGRNEVNIIDIFLLENMLWKIETDILKIRDIIHKEIFGDVDTIKRIEISANNDINKFFGIKEGYYNDFLKYRKAFDYSKKDIFERNKEEIQKYIEIISEIKNRYLTIENQYKGVKLIENKLETHLFTKAHKNKVFTNINMEEVRNNIKKIEKEIIDTTYWLEENKELYHYNEKVNKSTI